MQPMRDPVEFGRKWRPVLVAYFLRRVRDHYEAEDLTQELLTRLFARQGEAVEMPEAYVFRMASNLLADRSRRMKVRAQYREMVIGSDDLDVEPLDPFRIVSARADVARLAKAIEELPQRTRTIFILYRLENISQDRIADSFGISVSAVKKHVARAMARIVQCSRQAEGVTE